jgi:cytochrome c-type biogenesis protein CcmH/NrfG
MNKLLVFFGGCLFLLVLAIIFLWFPFKKRPSFNLFFSLLLLPVAACFFYWHWGSAGALMAYWQKKKNHELALSYLQKQKSPEWVVENFKIMLDKQPNQPKGWFLLGNIYVKQNKWQAAYNAYFKAHRYDSKNSDYLLALCQIDMALHTVLSDRYYKELKKAVFENPKNTSLRYMFAFAEYARKNYPAARKEWEIVLTQLPPNSADAKQVLALIAKTMPSELIRTH